MSTAVTEVTQTGVRYQVRDAQGNVVWEHFVAFGRQRAYRAGGLAFRQASAEQEAVANKFVGPLPKQTAGC